MVHFLEDGETLLDIAQTYHVCLDDLWEANPLMRTWSGWEYALPAAVFIPNVALCSEPMTYATHGSQTFHTVSMLTNVCLNWLYEANSAYDANGLTSLPEGSKITIPDRPDCYDLRGLLYGQFI